MLTRAFWLAVFIVLSNSQHSPLGVNGLCNVQVAARATFNDHIKNLMSMVASNYVDQFQGCNNLVCLNGLINAYLGDQVGTVGVTTFMINSAYSSCYDNFRSNNAVSSSVTQAVNATFDRRDMRSVVANVGIIRGIAQDLSVTAGVNCTVNQIAAVMVTRWYEMEKLLTVRGDQVLCFSKSTWFDLIEKAGSALFSHLGNVYGGSSVSILHGATDMRQLYYVKGLGSQFSDQTAGSLAASMVVKLYTFLLAMLSNNLSGAEVSRTVLNKTEALSHHVHTGGQKAWHASDLHSRVKKTRHPTKQVRPRVTCSTAAATYCAASTDASIGSKYFGGLSTRGKMSLQGVTNLMTYGIDGLKKAGAVDIALNGKIQLFGAIVSMIYRHMAYGVGPATSLALLPEIGTITEIAVATEGAGILVSNVMSKLLSSLSLSLRVLCDNCVACNTLCNDPYFSSTPL